ncbi:MAG: helix-turn-helix domain-containing protein [Treponema sp.]|nr:helix-turn-helix domain-containing protein [Treponema sp.]
MNFWEVVVDELAYQGRTRKWLAAEAKFDASTIGTGLRRNSMPQVDLALRIAAALDVPVEYLVTGKNPPSKKDPAPRRFAHLPQIRKNHCPPRRPPRPRAHPHYEDD